MSIKKVNGEEFEPSNFRTNNLWVITATVMLRECPYHSWNGGGGGLIDAQFKRVRVVLKAKRIDLRQQGKGQKEEEMFWEKGVFGNGTPFAIQFTIFYFFTLTMGLSRTR